MNACIIAYTFYESDYRVRRYAEVLSENGHTVDVIALRGVGQVSREVLNGVNIYRIQRRVYNEGHVINYILKISTFLLKAAFVLNINHLTHGYRLIHVHNLPDFIVFVGLLPKLIGTKLILDIHDILPEFYCQKFGVNMDSTTAKMLIILERLSLLVADHVIVSNDLWMEKIAKRGKISKNKISTMLNYPNISLFKEHKKPTKDTFNIIYAGTVSHIHGLDVLLRSMTLVKRSIANVRLDIYVRGNNKRYFDVLRLMVSDLGLQDSVLFHNTVKFEDLSEVYSKADLGVVCKRSGIFASEAFSTKILEFMAAGVPVVCSKTKIDEYYFNEDMMVFYEPGNYDHLASGIIELYIDKRKRRRLIREGRKFVNTYNWNLKSVEYLQLVEKLLVM